MRYLSAKHVLSDRLLADQDTQPAEEVLASFDRILQLAPHNAGAWYNRGVALGRLGRHEEALASFDHTLHLDSNYAKAWYSRGVALGRLERHEEALLSHDRALQRTPDDVKAWNNRGVALGNLERHEEALASFDHALELDPDDAGVWYNRGIALGDLGRYEEALSASDKSITAGIQLPDAFFDRIEYLIALGRWDEGVSALDDTLQRFVEARENASRVAEYILDRLLQRAGDAARWPAHVVTLLEVYGKHDALIALGQGLVRAIATLVSPMIADTAAREWLRVWREAAGSSVEMDLPLRLLDAAVS